MDIDGLPFGWYYFNYRHSKYYGEHRYVFISKLLDNHYIYNLN